MSRLKRVVVVMVMMVVMVVMVVMVMIIAYPDQADDDGQSAMSDLTGTSWDLSSSRCRPVFKTLPPHNGHTVARTKFVCSSRMHHRPHRSPPHPLSRVCHRVGRVAGWQADLCMESITTATTEDCIMYICTVTMGEDSRSRKAPCHRSKGNIHHPKTSNPR